MKSFLTKNIFLLAIIVLALFLRFYKIDKNPPSLNVDEVSNGYNAYSILKTARDEYGNFMPLTFRTFGDYNLPLSVYTLVPTIGLFGLNELGVRLPSAFFGTLTVLLTYLLSRELFKEKKIALIASFLLAISPWHLHFSRYDHEANFMVFFVLLGFVTFLYSQKKYYYLIISVISFGLALNTYHGAKIWVPLFLLAILFWFRLEILKLKKKLLWPIIILIIATLPIIFNFKNSLIRGQSVGVIGKPKALETFVSGYLSQYSPDFLFINGDRIGRHSVPGIGELYVFELPLVILGIIFLIRQKNRSSKFILTWLLISGIPPATATPTPHALRGLNIIPIWSIIASCGLYSFLSSKISTNFKKAAMLALILVATYNFATYLHLYWVHYPKEKALDWGEGYKQMVQSVDKIKGSYTTVAISSYYGLPYIYTLFYSAYDPYTYQQEKGSRNGFGKFEFFGASWAKTKPGKALLVTPPWQSHPPEVLKEIYSINGDLRFTISQTQE